MSKLKRAIDKNRKEKELSIRALAENAGVAFPTVCRMAKTDSGNITNLRKIAGALGKEDWELLRDAYDIKRDKESFIKIVIEYLSDAKKRGDKLFAKLLSSVLVMFGK